MDPKCPKCDAEEARLLGHLDNLMCVSCRDCGWEWYIQNRVTTMEDS